MLRGLLGGQAQDDPHHHDVALGRRQVAQRRDRRLQLSVQVGAGVAGQPVPDARRVNR
ncbi:hypothetical protein [Pseudonocardia sp. GCM10023141]|uniref:hypothetical protein n=1 Tax=Pseudonocardia sp. GCM10023141 TaxID=3252653 RepID=UPI0036D30BE0